MNKPKIHLSISDFSEFNKAERLIKIFAWICILITGYFVFQQFSIAYINSQNPDKEFGFGFLLIIGEILLMSLSLALPLIYISY